MKKTIEFGKIDYDKRERKTNAVDISIELKDEKGHETLSICGNIWNGNHTDVICCGQCLDEINIYLKNNKIFKKIYRLWKLYHLNDMHAGTKKQEEFLKSHNIENWANEYKKTCEILEKYGFLYDDGIKFGSTWHYWEIPENDLKEIKELIQE